MFSVHAHTQRSSVLLLQRPPQQPKNEMIPVTVPMAMNVYPMESTIFPMSVDSGAGFWRSVGAKREDIEALSLLLVVYKISKVQGITLV